MNIIMEGPDCVGKGTTIEKIRNTYNKTPWQNIFYTGVKMAKDDQYQYMVSLFAGMWKILSLGNILSDRSHISEYVFAKKYRDMPDLETDILFDQEAFYLSTASEVTVLILLVDTPENLLEREDGLSHSQTVQEKQAELDLYIEAFNKSRLPKFIVDVGDKTPDQVLDYINDKIKKWRK